MSRYIQVQYTPANGVLGPRFDNVIPGSRRVWSGPGAVLEIPEDEAFHYLVFSDIFKRVGKEAVQSAMIRDSNSAESIDMLCGFLSVLSTKNLEKVIATAQGFLDEPKEDEGQPIADLKNPASIKAAEKRIRKIFETVDSLPDNGDNFHIQTGRPFLVAVQRNCLEKNITQRELDAAWALKQRVQM